MMVVSKESDLGYRTCSTVQYELTAYMQPELTMQDTSQGDVVLSIGTGIRP